jgi:dipeptidyl aminopeptidase/acylaminoacyl peptidase
MAVIKEENMENKITGITAYTYIGDFGQAVERFELKCEKTPDKAEPSDFTLEGTRKDISGLVPSEGVIAVETKENTLILKVDPFVYRPDFSVKGQKEAAAYSFGKKDVTKIVTKTADEFDYLNQDGVVYRLFKPEAKGLRPLVLFLHGGGECGSDNEAQMRGTMGAANLAERWPDMYVMAPQAPDGGMSFEDRVAMLAGSGFNFEVVIGNPTESGKYDYGWNRDYLSKVCNIIRAMIAEGLVDSSRIYITGMSMGGAGVIRTLSVDPGLFAAAAPICPSMNGETYAILNKLPDVPTWISAAYIDHQQARHAYIIRAIQNLSLS